MDWNVQCDPDATRTVFGAAGDLTLVTLGATLDACVRESDVARLSSKGPVGALLARQLTAHALEYDMVAVGGAHSDLPDDLLNFQYDVAACAVAIGQPVAELDELVVAPRLDERTLRFEPTPTGRAVTVTTAVDRDALNELWLEAIGRVDAAAAR
jgi:inosine-uridine nucleoside N-ribohydrolase